MKLVNCKKAGLPGLVLVFLLLPGTGFGEDLHVGHCLAGCPLGASSENTLILRSIYALSFNHENLAPDWAAYGLKAESVGIASSLSRAVLADPFPVQTMVETEFAAIGENSDFVRSYLVPLVNFSATPFWQETNYLTNMVLRNQNLNRGAWYGLEWAIRNLVSRTDSLYILSGPLYRLPEGTEDGSGQLPVSRQKIAAAYFQVVATAAGDVTAFIFPQQLPVHVHHCEQRISLFELEELSGLDFFPLQPQWPAADLDRGLGCQ